MSKFAGEVKVKEEKLVENKKKYVGKVNDLIYRLCIDTSYKYLLVAYNIPDSDGIIENFEYALCNVPEYKYTDKLFNDYVSKYIDNLSFKWYSLEEAKENMSGNNTLNKIKGNSYDFAFEEFMEATAVRK